LSVEVPGQWANNRWTKSLSCFARINIRSRTSTVSSFSRCSGISRTPSKPMRQALWRVNTHRRVLIPSHSVFPLVYAKSTQTNRSPMAAHHNKALRARLRPRYLGRSRDRRGQILCETSHQSARNFEVPTDSDDGGVNAQCEQLPIPITRQSQRMSSANRARSSVLPRDLGGLLRLARCGAIISRRNSSSRGSLS
jgi:hypothetical protein